MNFCPSAGYEWRKVSSDWKHVFFWWVELGGRCEAEKWKIALEAHSVDMEMVYSSTFEWFPSAFLFQCRGIKQKTTFNKNYMKISEVLIIQ